MRRVLRAGPVAKIDIMFHVEHFVSILLYTYIYAHGVATIFACSDLQPGTQIMVSVTVTHLPVGIVVTSLITYGASLVTQKMLWLWLA